VTERDPLEHWYKRGRRAGLVEGVVITMILVLVGTLFLVHGGYIQLGNNSNGPTLTDPE